jgi:hypothetical protein
VRQIRWLRRVKRWDKELVLGWCRTRNGARSLGRYRPGPGTHRSQPSKSGRPHPPERARSRCLPEAVLL